ncbi:MAG: hypothetical protein V1738_05030 [Patescibacteria group bacterium]
MKSILSLSLSLLSLATLTACDDDLDDNCVNGYCFNDYEPCGDGVCQTDEDCPEDCAIFCGNGVCDTLLGEDAGTCSEDCAVWCGDNICNGVENQYSCEHDCGPAPLCGDNICEDTRGETDQNCFEDCGCWNGRCDLELGENEHNCYQDCGRCGNGVCGSAEDHFSCSEDCARPIEICGDLICEFRETVTNCPEDCGCNNFGNSSTCDLEESPETCPEDCASTCGDGVCDESIGENWLYCPVDCVACHDTPDRPIDCDDGTGCWPLAVNCSSDTFLCGDLLYRCNYSDNRANCSNDVFKECPEVIPYFCRETDSCVDYDDWQACPSRETDRATAVNLPCSGSEPAE